MERFRYPKVILSALVLVALVVAGAWAVMDLWGERPEKGPVSLSRLDLEPGMSLESFGQRNHLPRPVLQRAFGLKSPDDLQRKVADLGLAPVEISLRVNRALAFAAEEGSKDWIKIAVKFAGWAVFLTVAFFLLKDRRITAGRRKGLLFAAVTLFGVLLGSDPSPMGTVKDTVVLLGKSGILFPPRIAALTVMLVLGTWLANKLLCAWGCQFGTLQDLLFRLGRDRRDRQGAIVQFKVPFAISNGLRAAVFALLAGAAFGRAFDLLAPIDPFRIFNPLALTVSAGIALALILTASLFVYRPWCHFLCPFGLAGWLVEKVSLYRVQVDYGACIACGACARACPTPVMEAILKGKRAVPDCFACGTCLEVCPTGAVRLARGRRQKPPQGKFTDKEG